MESTIQTIFLLGYALYDQTHLLPEHIREAAHRLMVCPRRFWAVTSRLARTAILRDTGTTRANIACVLFVPLPRLNVGWPDKSPVWRLNGKN